VSVGRLLGFPARNPCPYECTKKSPGRKVNVKHPAKVVVAGGGIGGLTATIALRRAGFEVVVFERATELREVGAGLLLAANAQKALAKLGLAEAVARLGTPASAGEIRSWRGHVLASIPAAELEKKIGTSSAAVHRADLQALLVREVEDGTLRLGTEVEAFEQDESGVRVLFADGGQESADILIGADGLRSRVRAGLFGPKEPRYAGYTAWRAVVEPNEDLLPWGAGFESWGRGARFGCAHVGRGRVYWFATANAPEGGKDGPPGSTAGAKATLSHLFSGWHRPVVDLVEAAEEGTILRTDIYDREPLGERWGIGRVTLLGDAAHPMTPNLGQGACQAIEDAVVLARCLGERGATAESLRSYERLRSDRVAMVVRRSRRVGSIGQVKNPAICWLRDRALAMIPPKAQLGQLEEVVGYEA
jgi:2-polyprenyl-6-methoxyphenol hydroxylase-like FAD-dependent oxidoreductase